MSGNIRLINFYFLKEVTMNANFSKIVIAVSLVYSGAAMAEQTIGVQPVATVATARARVEVSVIVPKIVILRVGAADATISTVTFTVGASPAVAGAPGNNLAYTGGTIPPTFATTVATTNPVTAAGVLAVGAWTNAAAGATLSCSLGALAGATAFAAGATAGGVPGTTDITVVGTTPAHPGANLTACNGVTTTPIAALTTLTGTFTYATAFTASAIASGTYGNTVTYTATTL
jgi:hypothetical protein